MARKSSTFYRLERDIGDGYKSVIEFHTVVNGNMYYKRHEERTDGGLGWIDSKTHYVRYKEDGNKEYKRFKSKGYTFAGIYEMDIYGHKTKIR